MHTDDRLIQAALRTLMMLTSEEREKLAEEFSRTHWSERLEFRSKASELDRRAA